MFERLIRSFGTPANQWANQHNNIVVRDQELQLASAKLLFSMLPADYNIEPEESVALREALTRLFGFGTLRCRRMIARAAAAHYHEPSLMAATTLLKLRTPETFRRNLLVELRLIAGADGALHDYEIDLQTRVERLLGLPATGFKMTG
jgi:uncharacterized tellurite resistance protein B-like protein